VTETGRSCSINPWLSDVNVEVEMGSAGGPAIIRRRKFVGLTTQLDSVRQRKQSQVYLRLKP
jgi:hypothetical protein